jgi:hypothetical protein
MAGAVIAAAWNITRLASVDATAHGIASAVGIGVSGHRCGVPSCGV